MMQAAESAASTEAIVSSAVPMYRRQIPRLIPAGLWVCLLSFALWLWRRFVMLRVLATKYRRDDLLGDIARFYDVRSKAWESVWGEHMHHGLYDKVDGKQLRGVPAQIRTMSQLLSFGRVPPVQDSSASFSVVDVGCGIGGASRFLARTFHDRNPKVTGITLSPVQADRAAQLNRDAQLSDSVDIQVRDALNTQFDSDSFDVVWSLESAEHMENKHRFIHECARILKPGGTILVLAWCIREPTPPLSVAEQFSIRRIMEQYCLPRVAPGSEYATEMRRAGLRHVQVEDWTDRAAPFWNEVVVSALFSRKGWAALFRTGWPLIRSAIAMRHVIAGIHQGVFRLVALTAKKPTAEQRAEEAAKAIQC